MLLSKIKTLFLTAKKIKAAEFFLKIKLNFLILFFKKKKTLDLYKLLKNNLLFVKIPLFK